MEAAAEAQLQAAQAAAKARSRAFREAEEDRAEQEQGRRREAEVEAERQWEAELEQLQRQHESAARALEQARSEAEEEAAAQHAHHAQATEQRRADLRRRFAERHVELEHEAALQAARWRQEQRDAEQELAEVRREVDAQRREAEALAEHEAAAARAALAKEQAAFAHQFKKDVERKRKAWLSDEKARRKKAVRDWNLAEKKRRAEATAKAEAEHRTKMAAAAKALAKGKQRYQEELRGEMRSELEEQERRLHRMLDKRAEELHATFESQRGALGAMQQTWTKKQQTQQQQQQTAAVAETRNGVPVRGIGGGGAAVRNGFDELFQQLDREQAAIEDERNVLLKTRLDHEQRVAALAATARQEMAKEERAAINEQHLASAVENLESELATLQQRLRDDAARTKIAASDELRAEISLWKQNFEDEQAAMIAQAKAAFAAQTSRAESSAALWVARARDARREHKEVMAALATARAAARNQLHDDAVAHRKHLRDLYEEEMRQHNDDRSNV